MMASLAAEHRHGRSLATNRRVHRCELEWPVHVDSRRRSRLKMHKKRPFQDVATEALVPLAEISVLLQAKRMCDPDHRQGFILVIFGTVGG
jgi:hypothetical protein